MTSTSSASATALPATNRRAFLGNSLALASAVAATAVPATAAVDHPDAELVELGRQWAATRRDIDASDDLTKSLSPAEFQAREWEIDAEGAALGDREMAVFNAIMNRPATSYAGLEVKARVADYEARLDSEHISPGTMPDRALTSLLSEVEQLSRKHAPALGTAAIQTPGPVGEHLDAALLALGREWQASVQRETAFGEEHDAACDRYVEPPQPEAVYHRADDGRLFPYLYGDKARGAGGPTERRIYLSKKSLDSLRHRSESWPGNLQTEYGKQIRDRANEIFAAHAAWDAERDRRRDACGLTAATATFQREMEVVRDLEWRIAKTPARTMAGIVLKARALLWMQGSCTADLELEWRDTIDERKGFNSDAAAAALLLDLLHMHGVTYAAGSAVAA